MKFSKAIIIVAVLALVAGPAAMAQQAGQQPPPKPPAQGQQPPAQQPPAQEPGTPAPPPVDPQEEADQKALFALPAADAKMIAEKGEEFVKKYPESRYNGAVYSKLAAAYLQLGDVDKLTVAGEKALELNPNNVDVLAMLAYAIPRKADSQQLDFQPKLQKAERYAKQTIEVLSTLTKPEQLTEEDFTKAKNEKAAMAHSGLGVIYLHRQQFPDMVSEMEQAVAMSSRTDPVDLYLLGLAYEGAKRPADAVTAYEKCSAIPGQMQGTCNGRAATAKKAAAAAPATPKP